MLATSPLWNGRLIFRRTNYCEAPLNPFARRERFGRYDNNADLVVTHLRHLRKSVLRKAQIVHPSLTFPSSQSSKKRISDVELSRKFRAEDPVALLKHAKEEPRTPQRSKHVKDLSVANRCSRNDFSPKCNHHLDSEKSVLLRLRSKIGSDTGGPKLVRMMRAA